jgi:methyl-accepting chemotaxis protein
MMSNNNQQRRRVFINTGFQLRYIIGVLSIILLSAVGSALLIYLIMTDDLQAQSFSAHASIVQASERLGVSIMFGNVVSMIVAGAIAVVAVLYGSHKLAGPLYRFEVLCQEIADGNLNDLPKLRETDQLHELAHAFSAMVISLRNQRNQRSELISCLHDQLNLLQSGSNLTDLQQESISSMRVVLTLIDGDDTRIINDNCHS